MSLAHSSLVVGERVVSRCAQGLLQVEYALFDPTDVLLPAATGAASHEHGYLTTAGLARDRLYAAQVTAALAREAFEALGPERVRALARSPSVAAVVDLLGANEAFEGGSFLASSWNYAGVWLDLEALAVACPLRSAALLLQALHLVLVLEEVADDAPVRLLTPEVTADRRPTWRTTPLDAARWLPTMLRAMPVPARTTRPVGFDEREVREELLGNLRERLTASVVPQPGLHALADALASQEEGQAPAATAQAPDTERDAQERASSMPIYVDRAAIRHPRSHTLRMFEELRSHNQLLRGEEHLHEVARLITTTADESSSAPDLLLLASRAWLAAGEIERARELARRVLRDKRVPEDLRLAAHEILESSATNEDALGPPSTEPIRPMPILLAAPDQERAAPAGASLPPFVSDPSLAARRTMMMGGFPMAGAAPSPKRTDVVLVSHPTPAAPPPALPASAPVDNSRFVSNDSPTPRKAPASPPPQVTIDAPAVETPTTDVTAMPRLAAPRKTPRSEIVESLALPAGATEDMLALGARPTTPLQVRIAMTRLSRELGRDYRLWYNTTIRTNPVAIEVMQRHLRRRFGGVKQDEAGAKKLSAELTRHGALLSEILARALGAEWLDVSDERPGYWAMVAPPDLRVWPIGRVYRHFQQGHRESDLVAFFLDLEARGRASAT